MGFSEQKLRNMARAGPVDWHKVAGEFEPLRIRAYLRTGVVADRWLPLDAVVLYQAHRYQDGQQEVTVPGAYTSQGVSRLPIATHRFGQRDWYYKCSWAQWSHDIEGKDHWNKRFDEKYSDLVDTGRKRVVSVKSGQYKSYHMPIFYRVALYVEWYAVACKQSLELLLSTVTHLGKKRSQGWGRVRRWEIRRWDHDWSVWRDDELMRGIPAEHAVERGGSFNLANYGVRPSYWKSNNQMLLAMPGK